jgi:hypothetical protein
MSSATDSRWCAFSSDGTWYNIARYFVVAEDASDGRAHWCGKMIMSTGGERRPAPICVILPPRDS